MKFISLHLVNYQAHKDTTVKFTDGLNTIIGETDVGKSSILRALRKLVRDLPAGKDFINRDASTMTLSLEFIAEDGTSHTLTRQITQSKNLYFLDDAEYGGFGREIPEEIQRVLEMSIIELENGDKIDLYFSDQHDPPFMISRGSAGTRSKLIGRLVGLHLLDRGIVAVNRDIRAGNQELRVATAQSVEAQEKVASSKDTTPGHAICKTVQMALQKLTEMENKLTALTHLRARYELICDAGRVLVKKLTTLPDIVVDFPEIRENVLRLAKLQTLTNTLDKNTQDIDGFPESREDIAVNFDDLRSDIQKIAFLQNRTNTLTQIDADISQLSRIDFDHNIDAAEVAWTTLLRKMKICPTCKQQTHHIGDYCE